MRYERLIAQRYLHSKRQLRFINIIMLVSVIGITVGVAALVIVLSVFNGFNSVVTDVLMGFDPHVRIVAAQGKAIELSDSLTRDLATDRRIAASSPYIESKALLVVRDVNRVVLVKGVVDSTIGKVSGVRKSIVLGNFTLSDARSSYGIVIGLALADRLGATVGTEVTVVSPVGVDAMVMQFGQPLSKRFTVVGIYDSNNKEYDAHYSFISLDAARDLFGFEAGKVSGVEMKLGAVKEADAVKHSLQQRLGGNLVVRTWYDLHKDLYSVMKIERWSAYIILSLIIGVATFNMLGSLTMGVIEKRRDIGVLKALGATQKSILRIFMFEGIFVGAIGTVLGSVIGLAVCYLQMRYHFYPLDPTVYIIPAIPVEIRWQDFFSVAGASMLLSSLAALYPALRATRLNPVEAIKWE